MITRPIDVRDPLFARKLELYTNQQNQANENKQLHDKYVAYERDWVVAQTQNARQGLPVVPASAPPLQNVYNDDYTVSHPPFLDLHTPTVDPKDVIPPPNPFGPGSGPGFGGVNPTGATSDLNAIMVALTMVLQDLQDIKTALGLGAPVPAKAPSRRKK